MSVISVASPARPLSSLLQIEWLKRTRWSCVVFFLCASICTFWNAEMPSQAGDGDWIVIWSEDRSSRTIPALEMGPRPPSIHSLFMDRPVYTRIHHFIVLRVCSKCTSPSPICFLTLIVHIWMLNEKDRGMLPMSSLSNSNLLLLEARYYLYFEVCSSFFTRN
jgi:hypothetical protein